MIYSITPVIGIMINRNIAFGLAGGYTYAENSYNNMYYFSKIAGSHLSFALFARIHNKIDQKEKVKYYFEPYFGTALVYQQISDIDANEYEGGANMGLLFFVSNRISLELSVATIKYLRIKFSDDSETIRNFIVKYNLVNPNFGLKFYL